MPKGFSLPGWAFSAFINGAVMVIALHLWHKAPFVGKVVVGGFTAFHSMLLLTLLFWAARALGRLLAHAVNKAPLALPSSASQDYYMSVTGGWLGFIPATALWLWGQFYIFGDVTYRVSLAVFAVQVAWLAMGYVVAVVNGVGQWFRERHAPTETETGS